MRNFLNIADISSVELRNIIEKAKQRKNNRSGFTKAQRDNDLPMKGKSMVLIFEKPSTRTRISFELAVKQLGGDTIILDPQSIHYGRGDETLKDTAKVMSEYTDILMIRTSAHKNLEEMGKHATIPIINGLSEISHPCQIMADILTFEECVGDISGKTLAWVGDGNNNMSNSWIAAAVKLNFNLKIASPKKYQPNKNFLKQFGSKIDNIKILDDPLKAVTDVDCVMTDKWVSMNDKVNKSKKKKDLKKFQVNKKLMQAAKSNAVFMHCLPVGRGEEVTDEVIDGKQSVVWQQALNRLHIQKSIILWCMNS
jgi:ornithine carbamoyltransferase